MRLHVGKILCIVFRYMVNVPQMRASIITKNMHFTFYLCFSLMFKVDSCRGKKTLVYVRLDN